jgi:hypothetical protein
VPTVILLYLKNVIVPGLALALLVTRILGTDNPQYSATPDDFAVLAPLLDR